MSLSKSASELIRADRNARIKRIMWSSLDERINDVFKKFSAQTQLTSALGGLYITRPKEREPQKYSGLLSFQHINSTHIHAGHRHLGVKINNSEGTALENAKENNCQLWYSQSPSGTVLVFLAPYQSNVGTIEETEIIIAKYKEPVAISLSDIEGHFNKFFKYCACTSQNNVENLSNYMYRQYLVYNDFRYKGTFKAKILRFLERLIILLLGGTAILATLYVGGKI